MTMNQSRSAALSRRRAERSPLADGRSKSRQSVRANYERYLALARAQTLAGDQVEAENSYQHAEHYFRTMARARGNRMGSDYSFHSSVSRVSF
jgi:hypothetical protein